MGFTPAQVDEMSVWEFTACVDGYAEANGGKRGNRPVDVSEDQARAMGIVLD